MYKKVDCSIFVYWQQRTLLVEQPQFERLRCKLGSARHLELLFGLMANIHRVALPISAWPRVRRSIFSFTGPIYCSFHLATTIFSPPHSLSPSCGAAGGGRAARPPPCLHGALLHHAIVPEAAFGGVRHLHLLRQLAIPARLGRVTSSITLPNHPVVRLSDNQKTFHFFADGLNTAGHETLRSFWICLKITFFNVKM